MLNRNINLLKVIADRTLSSGESAEITQHLCRAAAEMGLHNVITDLGQAQALADDPLAGVPEVMPVKVNRVCLVVTRTCPCLCSRIYYRYRQQGICLRRL